MTRMTAEELAKTIADNLNAFGFDYKAFNKAMDNEHRTLQQNFNRLILLYLEHEAELPDYMFDGRNEASREFAKKVVDATKDIGLPLI